MTTNTSLRLTFRVLVPFALGYYLSYVFRNINSVIAPDLIGDIGLSAAGLGFLTGAYFLSFAFFQLPLGVFLDRIGPKKTETYLLVVAAVGSFYFSFAENITDLILARALIGVGVSACLMASFKAFAIWFPKEKLPLTNGLVLMAGGLGAMSATAPIEVAVQITNWRTVFLGLTVLCLAGAAAIYFIVPDKPEEFQKSNSLSVQDFFQNMRLIIKKPIFLKFVPICVLTQGAFLALQTLWIGPWLRDVSNMNRNEVATGLLAVGVAMTAGYLFTGILASKLNKRGYKTETVVLWGMIVFLLIEIILVTDLHSNVIITWCLFAFFGTSGSVIYATLSQHYETELLGRVSTMLNLLIFLCAFLMQWFIGVVINFFPYTDEGAFPVIGYYSAFASIIIFQMLGFFWFWMSQRIEVLISK